MIETRLQVVLARAGLGSRRACEGLIESGAVTVNGRTITKLGSKVEPSDEIRVRGKKLPAPQALRYFLPNKPRGVVTTASDPQGRRTVLELLVGVRERVVPVGRLDLQSEGLVLLTNDGELADALMHPRSGVARIYRAKVHGELDAHDVGRLARGVVLERRRTAPIEVRTVTSTGNASWVEVTVREGRKHLVRDALASVGHPVAKLRRTQLGPLLLARLASGKFRELAPAEVTRLRATAGLSPEGGGRSSSRRGKRPRGTAPARQAGAVGGAAPRPPRRGPPPRRPQRRAPATAGGRGRGPATPKR